MYEIIKHLHSGLRWLVLLGLIYAVYDAYTKWKQNSPYNKDTKKAAFIAFNLTHTQALVGLIIYFITPRIVFGPGLMKDAIQRFFAMEHPLMMLIAITLITIGYIKGKRGIAGGSFKTIFWFYSIALLIILASIPWPWMKYGTSWY